jgi:hypothetical protein
MKATQRLMVDVVSALVSLTMIAMAFWLSWR